jgi:N-acyl-D-amino-acid deacylase
MHELVVRGGTVLDGLGSDPLVADVAISGGRVVAVGPDVGTARRIIDASGLIVSPGFIDPHSHSDMVPLMEEPQPFKLLQGVTTEIVGNCGFTFAPLDEGSAEEVALSCGDLGAGADIVAGTFGDFLDRIEAAGPTNHIAALVGHHALRLTANGPGRALDDGALEEMCRLADAAFRAGAIGLSTGLWYTPGAYSDTDEVVALARVAHRWQRPYASHMRDEGRRLADALDEAIEVGRRARVRVQISHCKAAGRESFGGSGMLLTKLHEARAEGVDVRGDQYPYTAAATLLSALLPAEAHEGGAHQMVARLRDPRERVRLRRLAEAGDSGGWADSGPADVLITSHADPELSGRTLEQIARDRDPWEVLSEALIADANAMMVVFVMDEADVRAIMVDPLISIGSDNGVPIGMQHPRTYGCFPRFLGHYVRDGGVVGWPEAIRKMTSSTAVQFGLVGRGWLGEGAIADVCVFNPQRIGHDGDFLRPNVAPTGVEHVLLAGEVVVEDGAFTGMRKGKLIRATNPSDR